VEFAGTQPSEDEIVAIAMAIALAAPAPLPPQPDAPPWRIAGRLPDLEMEDLRNLRACSPRF